MKPPYQVPLAIDRPLQQRLDSFVAGANGELLQMLLNGNSGFQGIWIAGTAKSGKTHLLRGYCLHRVEQAENTAYVSAASGVAKALNTLEHASSRGLGVCLDDIGEYAGIAEAQDLILAAYQSALQAEAVFIASHDVAAAGLDFQLEDLNSRMRSLQHFVLQPLADADKAELLRSRAQRRGYAINQAVLDYWLARAPRDTGTLLTDLDVLDRATLARKQTVTIPLLKQVLGY